MACEDDLCRVLYGRFARSFERTLYANLSSFVYVYGDSRDVFHRTSGASIALMAQTAICAFRRNDIGQCWSSYRNDVEKAPAVTACWLHVSDKMAHGTFTSQEDIFLYACVRNRVWASMCACARVCARVRACARVCTRVRACVAALRVSSVIALFVALIKYCATHIWSYRRYSGNISYNLWLGSELEMYICQ